ncbi:MAG: hypothetical protein HFE81_05405 [Bacilli bacterium]|nr:hypothetical protein [Bacilli bacterium]
MESVMPATVNRDKGYINLDEILKLPPIKSFEELVETLKENKKVTIKSISNHNNNKQLVFSFKYNNIEYFYKYDCPREPFKLSPYNELVACEIADDLFIPHVNYDLATVCGFKGLISKDFRQDYVQYISGKEFLINNHPLGNENNIASLNNLEDIWLALEEHYDRKPEYQNIVSKVMQKIVNMFLFDILTGQVDRGDTNWWLIEYPNGLLDLQPLFDNVRILILHHQLATERYPSVSKILLTVNQDVGRYCEDNLEEFLKVSDQEFNQTLLNILWTISQENLQKVFIRIEEKTKYHMPNELKQFYLKEFDSQLNFITDTYDNIMSSKHR